MPSSQEGMCRDVIVTNLERSRLEQILQITQISENAKKYVYPPVLDFYSDLKRGLDRQGREDLLVKIKYSRWFY